jgi:hypothetical protein
LPPWFAINFPRMLMRAASVPQVNARPYLGSSCEVQVAIALAMPKWQVRAVRSCHVPRQNGCGDQVAAIFLEIPILQNLARFLKKRWACAKFDPDVLASRSKVLRSPRLKSGIASRRPRSGPIASPRGHAGRGSRAKRAG